jgi:hypothetical protein
MIGVLTGKESPMKDTAAAEVELLKQRIDILTNGAGGATRPISYFELVAKDP